MSNNEERVKEFERVVKPVAEWMEKNCGPYDKIIIDTTKAELVIGDIGFPMGYNLKINDMR